MAPSIPARSARCPQCGRALLLPLLREVTPPDDPQRPRVLVRCAYCGKRSLLRGEADPLAAQRAAALSFVTRGHRTSHPQRRSG